MNFTYGDGDYYLEDGLSLIMSGEDNDITFHLKQNVDLGLVFIVWWQIIG